MYKTVRKGDASLQYTILPQTDQFSASGFPPNSGKPRPRIIKYTMGTLMVLIILSCAATPFLMNQNDHNLFASTVLAMGRVGHNTIIRNSTKSQTKDVGTHRSRNRIPMTITESSTEIYRRKDAEDETTLMSGVLRVEEQESEDFASSDSLATTTQRTQTSSELSANARQDTASTIPSSTPASASSPTTLVTPASTPNEAIRTSSSSPRKVKMPRVTLKLRENETIPQMYMKAGIASYKKGNITTSVLAHGLSLEGLIFKTPEGTIKPWPQKWFFTDSSSDFQWKGSSKVPAAYYMAMGGLGLLIVPVAIKYYRQRKLMKRQRQCVEEPEVEGHEEDKSTLLSTESQETEEKE